MCIDDVFKDAQPSLTRGPQSMGDGSLNMSSGLYEPSMFCQEVIQDMDTEEYPIHITQDLANSSLTTP